MGKLVRDKIPQIIEASGKKPIIRVLNDVEYLFELDRKLLEEIEEFKASRSIEELADILEVLFAYVDFYEYNIDELYKVFKEKHNARGGFINRIFWLGNEEV